jgi:hypothetical protein
MPADAPPSVRKRSLRFFVGNGWKMLYARVALRANAIFPGAGGLPELHSADGALARFFGRLVPGASHAVVQIGTPGPYQKASVLLASGKGEAAALVKVAMVATADNQLSIEAAWLRDLVKAPELDGQLPRLLGEGVAPNGRNYIVTTLAPAARTTRAFTAAHVAFLGALGRVAAEIMSYRASPCARYLEDTLQRLAAHMTPTEEKMLQRALRESHASLAGWTGPFVIAQGDFAPWNIRVHGDRIFVFDWEYARGGANPLADALNYFVLPRAVAGHGVSVAFFVSVLRRVERIARGIAPEWTWRPQIVSALGLAYLLEVILHYSTANTRLLRSDPVVGACFELVERRSKWMA